MQMSVCVLPCLGSENKNKTEEKIQRLSNIPAKENQEAPKKNIFVLVVLLFCAKSQQVLWFFANETKSIFQCVIYWQGSMACIVELSCLND